MPRFSRYGFAEVTRAQRLRGPHRNNRTRYSPIEEIFQSHYQWAREGYWGEPDTAEREAMERWYDGLGSGPAMQCRSCGRQGEQLPTWMSTMPVWTAMYDPITSAQFNDLDTRVGSDDNHWRFVAPDGCDECFGSCSQCETVLPHSTLIRRRWGSMSCSDCTVYCIDCGVACWTNEVTDDGYEGDRCYECDAIANPTCPECGDTAYEDSYCDYCDSTYCSDNCHQYSNCDAVESLINSYDYAPYDFNFLGKGPRYMGVELEVDGNGNAGAEELMELAEDRYYLKEDGSLDAGYEIVTHPASLEYHLTKMPWEAICETALSHGQKSHQANTCGLHVHVSRNSLGNSAKSIDLTISKLILLFWRHWRNLVKFSRRESYQVNQWASSNYECPVAEKYSSALMQEAKWKGRYSAVNVNNRDTVEFRMWRGSLKPDTIRATLEMVDVLVSLAKYRGTAWIFNSTWDDVVREGRVGYKYLTAYLEDRNLSITNQEQG